MITNEFPRELQNIDFDQRVAAVIEAKAQAGKNEVVILDIGSGEPGSLVFSFQNTTMWPQLYASLEKYSGIRVSIIGITGAMKNQSQGTESSRQEKVLDNTSRVLSKNYIYTITSHHTLSKFLKEIHTTTVDVCFSTFAIGYMTPNNFRICVKELVDHLSHRGEFFGIVYDYVPAGYQRSDMGSIDSPPTQLPENHPLKMVFDPHFTDREFFEYESLPSKEKAVRFVATLRVSVNSGVITVGELLTILKNRRVINSNLVYRHIDSISNQDEYSFFLKLVSDVLRSHRYLTADNWFGLRDLLFRWRKETTIRCLAQGQPCTHEQKNKIAKVVASEMQDELGALLVPSSSNVQSGFGSISKLYRLTQADQIPDLVEINSVVNTVQNKIRDAVDSYIENEICPRLQIELDRVLTDLGGLSIEEVADYLLKCNPVLIAEILDVRAIFMDISEMLKNKRQKLTTQAKQQLLRELQADEALRVFWNPGIFFVTKD